MKWILAGIVLVSILGVFSCAGNQFFSHGMLGMGEECVFLGFVSTPVKQEPLFSSLLLFALVVYATSFLKERQDEKSLFGVLFYIIFFERITRFAWKLLNPLSRALRKGILGSQLYNFSVAIVGR